VAQGFSQVPGVDYFDTFAPVARLASIRAVLAFATAENLETGQIDIKGAYLNGELTDGETIYIGFVTGNPWVFLGPPVPTPTSNPYPYSWVWVP